jgi:endonuclease G
MKKSLIGLVLALTSTFTFAQINDQCPQFTVNGTPLYQPHPGDQEICHLNYAVIHRCDVKAPVAVFEHLTVAAMSGPAKRKDNFHPDALVTPQCSASLADYATVGKTHDRGHMSPAGNNTQSAEIMSESFNLSNMLAQNSSNNRGGWRLLETAERQWATSPGTDFYIISGGIFDQGHPVTGNGLGIPTRIYKIIIEKNSRTVQAYLMPNAPISPATDWPKYQVSMSTIEQATQMDFGLGQQ